MAEHKIFMGTTLMSIRTLTAFILALALIAQSVSAVSAPCPMLASATAANNMHMMDHSQMDHSKMGTGQMSHEQMMNNHLSAADQTMEDCCGETSCPMNSCITGVLILESNLLAFIESNRAFQPALNDKQYSSYLTKSLYRPPISL